MREDLGSVEDDFLAQAREEREARQEDLAGVDLVVSLLTSASEFQPSRVPLAGSKPQSWEILGRDW